MGGTLANLSCRIDTLLYKVTLNTVFISSVPLHTDVYLSICILHGGQQEKTGN